MIKQHFFYGVIIGLIGLVLSSFLLEKQGIKYMQVATIESSDADKPFLLQTYKDRATKEIIFIQKTKDKLPLYYFKKVKGEVCFSKKCRLLDIRVYWNITGRYLGFELPKGEFLSKYDHEPYTETEYQQLHALISTDLSNSILKESNLRNAFFKETVLKGVNIEKVRVNEKDWISKLESVKVEGVKEITEKYKVNLEEKNDEYGDSYFEIEVLKNKPTN